MPVMTYPTLLAKTKWKQTVPVEEPPPSPPAETATHYPSLAEAVQPILALHPQVIAFGEFHPSNGYDYRTAKVAFAEEILPLLAQEGIKNLIIEQILNDPMIISELDRFYKTGKLGADATPLLWSTFEHYTDRDDLIKILIAARKLGIRIHPGGMTLAQAQETIFRDNWCCNSEIQLRGWHYAEQAARSQIKNLLKEGVRFAIYNGVKHHNLVAEHVTEAEGGTNYGEYLSQTLGNKYSEVELYPVGGLETLPEHILKMWGVPDWEELIPEKGVNLIERSSGHILIY